MDFLAIYNLISIGVDHKLRPIFMEGEGLTMCDTSTQKKNFNIKVL